MKINLMEEASSSPQLAETLLPLLPSAVVYRRQPLEAANNGWGLWREAIEKFVPPAEDSGLWNRLVHGGPIGQNLSAEEYELASQILKSNVECLRLLHDGIQRGRIQFSEFESLDKVEEESASINQLSDLARLPLIRKVLATEGDYLAAADALIVMLRMGEMICNGDGQILHYLIGLWIRGAAVRAIGRQAAMPETSQAARERLLAAVERGLAAPDGLQQSLRIDFLTITLKQLEQTTDSADLESIVQSIVQIYYLPPQTFASNAIVSLEMRDSDTWASAWTDELRRQLLVLLQGHPRPFDKLATARTMADFLAERIHGIDLSVQSGGGRFKRWLHGVRERRQSNRFARQLHDWPAALAPGAAGESEVEPHEIDNGQIFAGSLTELELVDARHRLQKIDNSLGLVLVEHFLSFDYSPFMLEHRTMMKSLRGLLARRLHEP